MRGSKKRGNVWTFFAIVALLAIWVSASATFAEAQGGLGQNAVYNSSNGTVGSSAFIDASVFVGNLNPNICALLHSVLNGSLLGTAGYPAAGAVIDARGLNSGNTSMTCTAANPSPWAGITNPPPSTILLPAGTIVIPSTWGLPPNTRLVGEGDNIGSGTTLQAKANFQASTAMIQFGLSSLCTSACTGISVENLNLDGQGQSVNGIVNSLSQTLSVVDHVGLKGILGTGLSIFGNASNSGPYTNVTFNSGSLGNSSTTCASINGVSTKGIQWLTCVSNGIATAGVLLDASNNSLKDISVDGYVDGVQVGENANAISNVLVNIHDPGNASTMINLIHICGVNGSSTGRPCTNTNHMVTDLVIMGATAPPYNCPTASACLDALGTIKDDVTGTFLTTMAGDNVVSVYVLGKSSSPSNGGYSRFTTSPNAPSWSLQTVAGTPSNSCTPGSLLSDVNVTTAPVFYVCKPIANGGTAWASVK
jgi:hypothetical protein